jgi:hypothetical protein
MPRGVRRGVTSALLSLKGRCFVLKSDRYARFNVDNLPIMQWLTSLQSCEWMCRYGQVFAEPVPSLRSRPSRGNRRDGAMRCNKDRNLLLNLQVFSGGQYWHSLHDIIGSILQRRRGFKPSQLTRCQMLFGASPAIAVQPPPILMGRFLVVPPSRDDRLNPQPGQAGSQRVAVIASIRDQALGPLAGASGLPRPADRDRVERFLEAGDLHRGRRVQVCSQRSTRAIDQNQPLCTLAPLGLADLGPPFFAGMKPPSAKDSSQRIFSRSFRRARKARQSVGSTPVSSHCLSRRQQVLGLPYRRGSSLHGAPVQRIQRMPSKQRRSST